MDKDHEVMARISRQSIKEGLPSGADRACGVEHESDGEETEI